MKKDLTTQNTPRTEFNSFIRVVGNEIEYAQLKTVSVANVQMLWHYWKMGQFILHHQQKLGWGAKVIEQIAKAIREKYPNKKGYSPRNLKYMCQFAKEYPLEILKQLTLADEEMKSPTVNKVLALAKRLNQFAQEVPAQIESVDYEQNTFGQELPAQIENAEIVIGQEALAQITETETLITQEPLAQLESVDYEQSIFGQEVPAQIKNTEIAIVQEIPAQIETIQEALAIIMRESFDEIEKIFTSSVVANINWASQMVLFDSGLPLGVRYWYMKETIEHGWSSNILSLQIQSGLFQRQMKAGKVNNFTKTLPDVQSDMANYLFKDPFIFDIMGTKERADERDIEEQLVAHVVNYLLEMGTGFAFVARQKHFNIGGKDFYADLILYNIKLKAYVVVELKATEFKPEYAGQLNFYVNVVNDKLKNESDNNTIGLILCKGKSEVMAQYALDGYINPIGVSDYQLSKAVPENLKSALPSIEDVEKEMTELLNLS